MEFFGHQYLYLLNILYQKSVVILITFYFSTLSIFLKLNKPVTNQFGTWRSPPIHTVATVDLKLANHVMHWFLS